MNHLEAFSKAADEHGGSRSVTTGYDASAEYVIAQLEKSNFFTVTKDTHETGIYEELSPPSLELPGTYPPVTLNRCEQTTGWQHYYVGCDYAGVRYGGNGTFHVEAKMEFVADACAAGGWASFTRGRVALVEASSACDYYTRGLFAEDAGAAALIFASVEGSNGYPGSRVYDSSIPASEHRFVQLPCLGVTHAIGQLLRQAGATARLSTHTLVRVVPSFNVIAESRVGDAARVVMMGSHLDSVPEGPGLNDNGSGSASTLEIALEWAARQKARLAAGEEAECHRQPRVRFGWWGSEEVGLVGSRAYVDKLVAAPAELEKLLCYLNYDMEAGPNYVRMVHDASTSLVPSTIPASEALQQLFENAWTQEGLSFALTPMSGGSDFLPFNLAGVPTGGLATGASGRKTEEQRAMHGGLANTQLDPCYHAPCDTLENINRQCLRETARVAATVLERLVRTHADKADRLYRPAESAAVREARYHSLLRDPQVKKAFGMPCNALEEDGTR